MAEAMPFLRKFDITFLCLQTIRCGFSIWLHSSPCIACLTSRGRFTIVLEQGECQIVQILLARTKDDRVKSFCFPFCDQRGDFPRCCFAGLVGFSQPDESIFFVFIDLYHQVYDPQ